MEIKKKIKNVLEQVLIASPMMLVSFGLINFVGTDEELTKYLGKRVANNGNVISYSLLNNGKIRATEIQKSKWGMFSPITYTISQNSQEYFDILNKNNQ